MAKLEELIQEFCPNGVEYRNLENCCEILDNKRKPVTKVAREAGEYPYYGANGIQDYVADYIFDGTFVLVGEDGSVVTEQGTPIVTWATGKIWVNNHAHIVAKKEGISLRYLYHFIQTVNVKPLIHGNIPKLTGGDFRAIQIPVPPLPVQNEIVRILDTFTDLTAELIAELIAELAARKKQYDYYRNLLLEHPKNKSSMVAISELGKWSGGKTPSTANKEFWENGTIPWISSKDMKFPTLEDTEDHLTEKALTEGSMTLLPEGTVAIVTRSGILKHTFPVAYVPFRTTVNQDIKVLVVKEGLSARYVFHALQTYGEDIRKSTKKQGGTVDSLDFQKVLAYEIPVPALDVQNRLVEVLDNFEAICSDLKIGLPAEIEARQKQYESYRDALLTYAATGKTILTDRQTDELNGLILLCQYVFGFVSVTLNMISENHDSKRKPITSGNREAGEYPYYGASGIVDYVSGYIFDGDYLLVSEDGNNLVARSTPIAFSISGKNWVNNHAHVLKFDCYATRRYVEFYLNAIDLSQFISGGAQPKLNQKNLNTIPIPLPAIKEQERIVGILDRFDALCNDISSGLPAEIEARTKQYEYYRDKLLTFEPAK